MYTSQKKELLKNVVIIGLILLIAIVSTRYIYFKYKQERNVDYSSESLNIVFHEKTGSNITLDKVTPVTDSVGLSSKAYTFTITNNRTEPVKYKIYINDDINTILKDNCKEYLIGKEYIKISIKENNKENEIYTLSELPEALLLDTEIEALGEKNYSIRVWIDKDTTIPNGSNLHYHGTINVEEG